MLPLLSMVQFAYLLQECSNVCIMEVLRAESIAFSGDAAVKHAPAYEADPAAVYSTCAACTAFILKTLRRGLYVDSVDKGFSLSGDY